MKLILPSFARRARQTAAAITALALASLLGLGLAGCGRSSSPAQAASLSQSTPDTRVVKTALVQPEVVAESLELTARVQADPARTVHVYPPAGGRVISLAVRPGDHAVKGQTLAVLESSEIAGARSDYTKALAARERADRGLKRAQLLFDHQVMPEKDYLDAKAEAVTAESELRRTQERLRMLGVPLEGSSDQLRVAAPRSGAVLDLGAAPGEFNKALDAQTPLCTIADLSSIWVVGDVYEQDLAAIRKGVPVEVSVSAYPGETWKGRVDSVSDQVDPVTRSLKLRVVLPNPDDRLKPEMFARIRVSRGTRQAIVVPQTAVLHEGEKASVIVQSPQNKFEERTVKLGPVTGQKVEIVAGLKPGEQVVVEGAALLRNKSEQENKND